MGLGCSAWAESSSGAAGGDPGGPGPGLGSSGSAEGRVDIHQVKGKRPVAGRRAGQGSSRGRGPGAGAGGEGGPTSTGTWPVACDFGRRTLASALDAGGRELWGWGEKGENCFQVVSTTSNSRSRYIKRKLNEVEFI